MNILKTEIKFLNITFFLLNRLLFTMLMHEKFKIFAHGDWNIRRFSNIFLMFKQESNLCFFLINIESDKGFCVFINYKAFKIWMYYSDFSKARRRRIYFIIVKWGDNYLFSQIFWKWSFSNFIVTEVSNLTNTTQIWLMWWVDIGFMSAVIL